MQPLISFSASATTSPELGRILSDYLALDRARIIRRLMVARFGCLAVLAAVLETVFPGFSPFARVVTVALCVVPPLYARIVELARERRLSRRIDCVDGAVTPQNCSSVRQPSGAP